MGGRLPRTARPYNTAPTPVVTTVAKDHQRERTLRTRNGVRPPQFLVLTDLMQRSFAIEQGVMSITVWAKMRALEATRRGVATTLLAALQDPVGLDPG